jgi:hypothetical protein
MEDRQAFCWKTERGRILGGLRQSWEDNFKIVL